MKSGDGPHSKKASDVLNAFMDQFHVDNAEAHVGFYSSWRDIVGLDLAAHVKPVDIKNGSVILEVDHPGWMQRLQMKKRSIVRDIGRRFPELGVTNLYMRVGSPDAAGAERGLRPAEPRRPDPESAPDSEILDKLASLKKAIKDRDKE